MSARKQCRGKLQNFIQVDVPYERAHMFDMMGKWGQRWKTFFSSRHLTNVQANYAKIA